MNEAVITPVVFQLFLRQRASCPSHSVRCDVKWSSPVETVRHDRERACAALFGNHGRGRVHGVPRDATKRRALAPDRGYRRDDGSAELGAPTDCIELV